MMRALTVLALILVSACAPAAPAPQPVTPTATTTPASGRARIEGTVQEVTASQVRLSGGTFTLTPTTTVVRSRTGTIEDLKPGTNAGITAKPQVDGSLLASEVRTFPPSSGLSNPGQRPMTGDNLMTNATIESVMPPDRFTATFPGGDARVWIALAGQITIQTDGSVDDLRPGVSVTASAMDGVAQYVTIAQ